MNRSRISGQITVFAALSLMLVISLVVICIESALKCGLYTQLDMAGRLSVESAFGGYCTNLLEEFDVFALDAGESSKNVLGYFAGENIQGISKKQIEYISADLDNKILMTSQNGEGVENQILRYMKIGIFPELLAKYMNMEKEVEKAKEVTTASKKIIDCEIVVEQADKVIYELIELVEGIKSTEYGVDAYNGKAVITGDYFAKCILTTEISKESTAIDSDAVYSAVTGSGSKYINAFEIMDNMQEYAEVYYSLPAAERGENKSETAKTCIKGYADSYRTLKNAMDGAVEKTEKAIEKIQEYNTKLKNSKNVFERCKGYIESRREILGEDVAKTLNEDVEDMSNTTYYAGGTVCNAAFMEVALKHNLSVLKGAIEEVKKLDINLDENATSYVNDSTEACKAAFRGLSNKLLKFNYSKMNFEKGNGIKTIKTLQNTIKNGIGGLVMQDKDISDGAISYTDLASSGVSFAGESKSISNMVLINEYIMERFPTVTDYEEAKEKHKKEGKDESFVPYSQLSYVVEYILSGKQSDKENLNEAILKIIAVREGANFAHLIMDSTKKREAFNLATTLLGATGSMALVKGAQYLILALWALGESIVDVQRLLDGETLALIKTKDDWRLSLSNLLAMNFSLNEEEKGSLGESSKLKLNYEDYLCMLLALQNSMEKRFRVMDAMELRMISLGEDNFRMCNYMWSATGVVTVKFKDSGEYCTREYTYSYE